jgi:hypothetical protein
VASLVPIIVTESWVGPDGDAPNGSVSLQLTDGITSPAYVAATRLVAALSNGAIAQQVYAVDADSSGAPLVPVGAQYRVVESIEGAADVVYFVTVPAAPPGSRQVSDAVATANSATVNSATAGFTNADVGAYVNIAGFPAGTQIQTVHNATSVDLSGAAATAGSGLSLLIGASVALSALRP